MESKKQYLNFSKFILRTPLYPVEFANKLTDKEDIKDDEIILLCKNPVISEAIYIASPPLYYEMQKWLKGEMGSGKKAVKKTMKLKASLIRYLLRMATRCTPFGLFAGFTAGDWNTQTDIELLSQNKNIGNLRNDSIIKLIDYEIKYGKNWKRTRRNLIPCKSCIYQYLCPPPSNYEYILNKNNLCYLFKKTL